MIYQEIKYLYRELREIYYFFSGKPKGVGCIMMMHHVLPKGALGYPSEEYLNTTPEALEKFIVKSSKRFEFISLEEVPQRIATPNKHQFMVFTLDDGFESVYQYAYPIFKKYNIPFTTFVSTGFTGKECKTYTPIDSCENGLSEEQLVELSKDPLVTIGGHTVSHKMLIDLSVSDIKKEISENLIQLKNILGYDIHIFAYPYGETNDDVINEISSNNYNINICVLAEGGATTTASNDNYILPRVILDSNTKIKDIRHWIGTYMGL